MAAKKRAPVHTTEPWHLAAEQLIERPGVMFVTLLTDEAGAALIADGIVPKYVQQEARDVLAWLATDERGLVKRVAEERKRRLPDVAGRKYSERHP